MIVITQILAVAMLVQSGAPVNSCENLPKASETRQRLSDLFDYDRPSESERALLALAGLAERCGDKALAGEVMAQAARAQGIQGRTAEATATLARAEQLATDPRLRARILLERGRLARRMRQIPEAKAFLGSAFDQSRALGDDATAADAAHMLAILEEGASGRDWTGRGLAIAEASADPAARRWVGNLAFNAGVSLDQAGDHHGAALMFARSLASRRIENDLELVAAAELALSIQLAKIGRWHEALAIQQRLLREAAPASSFAEEVRASLIQTRQLMDRKPRTS